jgi:hypothetical protein
VKYSVDVEITGLAPLMHNNSNSMNTHDLYKEPIENQMDARVYKEGDKFVQPSTHILGALIKAATLFKMEGRGKKTFKDAVKAMVTISPSNIPLGIKPTPDSRFCVVQRQRITVTRPVYEGWKIGFKITVGDSTTLPKETLKDILMEAGQSQGIGTYRPTFGRFAVTKFTEVQ